MWIFLVAPAVAGASGAVHVGVVDGSGIRWESTYVGEGEARLADGTTLRLSGRQARITHQDDQDGLRPPLLVDSWQRIDLVGLSWTPDPALGFERRVDGWCPPAFGLAERGRLETIDPHVGFSVFADGRTPTLPGRVEAAGKVAPGVLLGTVGAFVLTVLVLILARRALARRVLREEAEAYMDQEFVGRR